MSKPHDNDRDDEPRTLFELARRSRPELGGNEFNVTVPKLPPSSPWSAENVTPDEPTIDRSEATWTYPRSR